MASVESMSQLERMGSELRCAICLSLFKIAATISCNHTFYRSCILESLRTNSCCPVCKTHSSRREARPAPQMDSLVEIFRGMETSAGVNLFTTQPSTQVAFPESGIFSSHREVGSLQNPSTCECRSIHRPKETNLSSDK
ncbi:hypothetical protein R1flu_003089 [Riccia fluitans]|uniref:RING-type domain-containing protein n=1 Tax=Riccia fluitans TaxID=41844 RepID=A0ABD1Y8X4_9MARC